jgi:hypothetical protein
MRETEMLGKEDGIHETTVEINSKTVHTVPMLKLRVWRDGSLRFSRQNGAEIEFAIMRSKSNVLQEPPTRLGFFCWRKLSDQGSRTQFVANVRDGSRRPHGRSGGDSAQKTVFERFMPAQLLGLLPATISADAKRENRPFLFRQR